MNQPIRIKLASAYLVIILTMILMASYALHVQKKMHIDEIGKSSVLLAEELFKRMDQRIFDLSNQLKVFSDNDIFQQGLAVSNIRYYQIQNINEHLSQRDTEWRSAAKQTITKSMRELTENSLARQLRELFITSPEKHFGYTLIDEILVTNQFGGLVAITSKSTDYDQSDETWWKKARDEGVYLGELHYDESAANYEVDLAVRIDNRNGKFAGVLLAGLDVKDIIRSAEVNYRKYNSTQIQISTSPGRLIYSTQPYNFLEDISWNPAFQMVKSSTQSFILKNNYQTRIYSSSNASGFGFFRGFDWIIIISHQLGEALAPYSQLKKQVITVFFFLTLTCTVLIYRLDRMIRIPLKSLTQGIDRLQKGDLKHQVQIKSNDEFGEVARVFNTMLEVRRESEELLIKSEERYRGLFDSALDMIHIVDKDGVIIDANPKELELMGYSRDEYLGKQLHNIIHPEFFELSKDTFQRIISGEKVYLTEMALISKTGEKIEVEVNASPHFENDECTSIRTVMRDIRERKRAEEEKALMEQQLRQAQKMEAIGTLAGGIAHDFNNILAVILGYTDLAIATSGPDHPFRNYLEKIQAASYRAKSLVYQILSFSRLSKIACAPRLLQPIIEEALIMLRPSIPTTVQIETKLSPDCGLVLVDTTQIHQILMNLCTNANHAMEKSGGVLRLELQSATLSENDKRLRQETPPGKYVELIVSDTGVGIDKETLQRIFDPFYTTKEQGKGTGMGLSIIHGIILQYRGIIEVKSVVSEGTEFHIYLPELDKATLQQSEEPEEIPLGHGNILFVDDEKMLADMGKEMLERLGYTVTVEYESQKAIETFLLNPDMFDMIITDQTMPEMTGTELARRILQIRPEIPIVLCTGYSSLVDEASARKMGIQEFALKPLTMTGIANILHQKLAK